MLKEYNTIREIVGPLMLVEGVEGVKYNELVEIRQENGEVRSGKVLEINRDKALVQLFEASQGIKMATSKARFLGHGIELVAGGFVQAQGEMVFIKHTVLTHLDTDMGIVGVPSTMPSLHVPR